MIGCILLKSIELCSQNEYRSLHMNYDSKCPETSLLEIFGTSSLPALIFLLADLI